MLLKIPKVKPLLAIALLLFSVNTFAIDTDGDGVDDSIDKFPSDRVAWEDTDNDGKPNSYAFASASDGFETGNFSGLGWSTASPVWSVQSSYRHTGTRAAISTSSLAVSYIQMTYTATNAGRFDYWVLGIPGGLSSCSGGGYGGSAGQALDILVDGIVIRSISCSNTWQPLSISLSVGTHTYQFRAAKTVGGLSQTRFAIDDIKIYDTALIEDTDDDNDGHSDTGDKFPKDPTEWLDNDSDGIGENADTDDDNDGVSDITDNCPKTLGGNADQTDTDSDGLGNVCDLDDDGDGVSDTADAFPLDATETKDTDLDGVGDNADPDADNDGVPDTSDAFQLDVTQAGYTPYYTFTTAYSQSIANAGDVNKDGYSDIVVGGECVSNWCSVHVISGKDQSNLYTFSGSEYDDQFGVYSVSGNQDMDNDGYPDIIVAAAHATNGGYVNVYSGRDGHLVRSFMETINNNFYTDFGDSVRAVGDVNQDGYADIIVSVSDYGSFGAAEVLSGKNGAVLYRFEDSNIPYFGSNVNSAGDVNGDGYADVMIAGGSGGTPVKVISGKDGSVLYTASGASFLTRKASISNAGDVNHDGHPDMIVGWSCQPSCYDPGIVQIYSGSDGSVLYTLTGKRINYFGINVIGFDEFGAAVSGAGDVNQDGYADFAVADPYNSSDFAKTKTPSNVKVYSGKDGSVLYAYYAGAFGTAETSFGYNLAGGEDINGDGYPDVITTANYPFSVRVFSGVANLAYWDIDSDGINDNLDNCRLIANSDQLNTDNDSRGDACDEFPTDPAQWEDTDKDGVTDSNDNCPLISNADQAESDGDNVGDACDAFPNDASRTLDRDQDGIDDDHDNCMLVANADQNDTDGDSMGDACDTLPLGPDNDLDGVGAMVDNCPLIANANQKDADSDNMGDACDDDIDNDGILNGIDNCPSIVNLDQLDSDHDSVGDVCDPIPYKPAYVTQVVTGNTSSCILTSEGGVKCWGANGVGQLGNNSTVDSSVPVNVSGLDSGVVAISSTGADTCALTNAGAIKCWGDNYYGQLGDGTTTSRSVPVDVIGLDSGVVAITASRYNTCALMNTGAVKCWGNNQAGQVGDNTTIQRKTPVDVIGLGSGVSAIATGGLHTCALMTTGGVKCWGSNDSGRLGDNSTTNRLTPVDVIGLGGTATAISAGDVDTCALISTGGMKCWGRNDQGELGDNSTTNRLTPVNVVGLSSGVTAISSGSEHNCAVVNGAAKCWGYNFYSQLGDNTIIKRTTPVDVSGLGSGVVAISAGYYRTCALTAVGDVKCWGNYILTPTNVTGIPFDADNDGAPNISDNCGIVVNADQSDTDGDGIGDACDPDADDDGVVNASDNCPLIANIDQLNMDSDAQGDVCDADNDNDGVLDVNDTFPFNATESVDTDSDGIGNNADTDDDGDGVPDISDADPLNSSVLCAADNFWNASACVTLTTCSANEYQSVAPTSTTDRVCSVRKQNDFSPDGKADILLRNTTTGDWSLAQLNGLTVLNQSTVGAFSDIENKIVSTGDFDGDGDADILTRGTDDGLLPGTFHIDLTDGATVTGSAWLFTMSADTSDVVMSTKDFNKDGKTDVLLRNSATGVWTINYMNGTNDPTTGTLNASTDLCYTLKGDGDYDGNGYPDLLLRKDACGGATYPWLINTTDGDTSILASGTAPGVTMNTAWGAVVTEKDFNGDGKADVLMRALTGSVQQWMLFDMNGTGAPSASGLLNIPVQSMWQFAADADFNGDGNADILLRSTDTGQWYADLLNGRTILGAGAPSLAMNPIWTLQATDDNDGDSKNDILLRNSASGQWYLNLMSGLTMQANSALSITMDLNYVLQND